MSLAAKLLSASGGVDKLYVDDVFSAYTYTGNGSTQTINNGIDLAGKGGMVWIKNRTVGSGSYVNHYLFDSARALYQLSSNLTSAVDTSLGTSVTSFNSNGFSMNGSALINSGLANQQVAWTFRKAPKFFDVVTYTGNSASSRAIAHSLGQEVGMVMTKATSTTGDWNTYHRSATGDLVLNSTATQTGSKALVNSATATTFTVSGAANTNAVTYVAYLFAHDPSADGIIQCGSFTADGSGNYGPINLGWEPQYILWKDTAHTENWIVFDHMRGWTASNTMAELVPNTYSAELANNSFMSPTATGFRSNGGVYPSTTYIYLAIRRPNKPPTTGAQVYNAIARTGTGAAATVTGVGFAPDVVSVMTRNAANDHPWVSRLTGGGRLLTVTTTEAETSVVGAFPSDSFAVMDGVKVGSDGRVNSATRDYINHFFKRAPGVFDVVCYTGTGVAKTEAHGLGVAPELMIVKARGTATGGPNWGVYAASIGATNNLWLNLTNSTAAYGNVYWNSTAPTTSVFSIGSNVTVNEASITYVAYLFASLPGISKVGSYTGNGTTQTINCGFTTGARFILIKRTDSAGDWYVWDTVRGLVAGNDPHLSLNSTTAEITTDDSLDPASVGFIVNQLAATNINVTSASYIYLSFA